MYRYQQLEEDQTLPTPPLTTSENGDQSSGVSTASQMSNSSNGSQDSTQTNSGPEGAPSTENSKTAHSNNKIWQQIYSIAKDIAKFIFSVEGLKWITSAGLGGIVCIFYIDGTKKARNENPVIGWQLTIGGTVVNGIPTAFFTKEGIDSTIAVINDPDISKCWKAISIPLITILALAASAPYAINEYGFIINGDDSSNTNTTQPSNSTASSGDKPTAIRDATLVGAGNFPLNFYGLSDLILNKIPYYLSRIWYGGIYIVGDKFGNQWYQKQHDRFILRDIIINNFRTAKKSIVHLNLNPNAEPLSLEDPILLLLNQIAQQKNVNQVFSGNPAELLTPQGQRKNFVYQLVRASFGAMGAAATIISSLSLECDVTQTFENDIGTKGGGPSWTGATFTMAPLYWLCIDGGFGALGNLFDITVDYVTGKYEASMESEVQKALKIAWTLLGFYFAGFSYGTSIGLLSECPSNINNDFVKGTTYVGTPLFNFIYFMKALKKWTDNYNATRGTLDQQQAHKTLSVWNQQCSRLEKVSDDKLLTIAQSIHDQQPQVWEQITSNLPTEKQDALQRLNLFAKPVDAEGQDQKISDEEEPPRKSKCAWLTNCFSSIFSKGTQTEKRALLTKSSSSDDLRATGEETCGQKIIRKCCPSFA